MVFNYLKIAVRSLRNGKGSPLITIAGLALGIAAALYIFQYIHYEVSYDSQPPDAKDIYRVGYAITDTNNEQISQATTFLPVAPDLQTLFPEIIDYNRILYLDRHAIVTHADKIFQQEHVIYSDASFFRFFGVPLVQGREDAVLREPNTVALSAALARKYFGDTNPVGQFIRLSEEFNDLNLLVTGVYKDIPTNTHVKPMMVVSMKSIESLSITQDNAWRWPIYLTYLRLDENTNPVSLAAQLPKFAAQHFAQQKLQALHGFFLQPFSDIHLYSHLQYEIEENGSASIVYLLLVVGIVIIVIAYVNYVNLATAQIFMRFREIGVRKILGSGRAQLIKQLWVESALFNLVALLVATTIIVTTQDYFFELTAVEPDFSFFQKSKYLIIVVACFVLATSVSALYPAVVVMAVKPVAAIKGELIKSGTNLFTRRVLVVSQFAATIGLLITAYAMQRQVRFMQAPSRGIEIAPILIVNAPRISESPEEGRAYDPATDPFRRAAMQANGVENVSISTSIPGTWIGKARGIFRNGHLEGQELTYYPFGVDANFLSTYALPLLAGSNFSSHSAAWDSTVVLTETAAQQLGYLTPAEAINERISFGDQNKVIIGVVQDYHHLSFRERYRPIIFTPVERQREFYSIRLGDLSPQSLQQLLTSLQNSWKAIYPSNPFAFSFLQDSFQAHYDADVRVGKLFKVFTGLAILLATFGLYGLASFSAMKRTKEIGIRKVLGSTTGAILVLLLTDIAMLIVLAGLIAIPFAYLGIATWLDQFAFRISITGWLFIFPILAIFVIALATISVKTWRTARANPVDALKHG